jgi:hypothetical protein
MTESLCNYPGDRDEALIAAVYHDGDGPALAAFEAHAAACARCRPELDALRGVRVQLARWSPPEPSFAVVSRESVGSRQSSVGSRRSADGGGQPADVSRQTAVGGAPWWREVPAWAQAAAALLFLGVSAGVANLDVHYDASGLSVRTGWMKPAAAQAPAAASAAVAAGPAGVAQGVSPAAQAAWRADLAALEQQMKNEIRDAQASAPRTVSASDADVIRRVRTLVEESEKHQQRELALRVAEVLRDVNSQRQADLVKIDRSLGAVQNNLGVEVMKQRQSLNLLYRASQRQ